MGGLLAAALLGSVTGLALRAEVLAGARYETGQPIPLRCTVTNTTSRPLTFLLPDRETGAPAFVLARVRNVAGTVTAHDGDPEGWWTVHILTSDTYSEQPDDRVQVPAGGSTRFDLDLAAVLRGHPSLRRGLPAGRYVVELDSEAGRSAPLVIELSEAKGTVPVSPQ
jgi:hypothetical protein